MRLRQLVVAVVLMGLAAADRAIAQPLASHLRIIAPAAPGGGWDQTARAMQQALQAAGIVRSASVENIPGAAGTIGLAQLIGAERGNGNVIMVSGLIMLAAVATHRSPVTLHDVTPIARLTGEYEVVVVPAASPYRTLADLLRAFRTRPESIAWAGGSAGGTDQILAGLIAEAVGVPTRRVNYVAFAGGGESMAAILGGQVTAGISGLGEYAAQIDAGAVRTLAISSAERIPQVDAPTLRELGVDVVLENWRSLVGPPGMSDDDRARLARVIAAMVGSTAWREVLQRFGWSDRYLAGEAYARFVAEEDARVQAILDKLDVVAAPAGTRATIGAYPLFVMVGLAATLIISVAQGVSTRRAPADSPHRAARAQSDSEHGATRLHWRALTFIAAAVMLNLLLMERAGFIAASIPLYWLTARAFDASRPVRDAVVAVLLSVAAYLLFAEVLQLPLPHGVLGF